MIQIRNVPDNIHKRLKIRAVEAGMSLSEYLLREITKAAEMPTREELQEMLRKLPRVPFEGDVAEMIRREREEREAQLWPSGQMTTHDKS